MQGASARTLVHQSYMLKKHFTFYVHIAVSCALGDARSSVRMDSPAKGSYLFIESHDL